MKYLGTMFLLASMATIGFAQTAPVPQHVVPYHLASGIHNGPAGDANAALVYNEVVQVPNTPWNRIRFTAAYLGESSYLVLRSLRDGITQTLDAEALETWGNTTAYFNGDAIELQLYVGAGDTDVFVEVGEVISGEFLPGDTPESQCGPVDDRIPSADARAARLLDIGCTAWLICDGRFISAGHCLSSSTLIDVVQFNVPPSLPNGTIQHPGPEDQYTYVTNSRIYTNGGVGNDWGVFEVNTNTTTGLTALEAQGDHFELVQNLTTPTIRITGYGVDFNNGDRNQTQQTHAGPNAASSGTTMRYQTDTEGGNSGSPVIDEATNSALGVHTHGGCTTGGGGNNSGTSLFHAAFWAEVGNLSCPGGSEIQCDDIFFFQARCNASGVAQAMVKITGDYAGETITFEVDGDPVQVTLLSRNGVSIGKMGVPGVGVGSHTVEMVDPACFDPIEITCAVNNRATAEWDAIWAEYEAMEQAALTTPTETRLLGNYPNPFNPSTTISYSVGEATWVTLKVFNTLGQEVATLVDSYQDTGSRTAVWNGLNAYGQRVSSGLYIYRLSAGNNIATGRMLLTK
ncbi:MAG: T9SS type A sorting domain-containing protein [Ignavibacteria bacterium]|nr:T9SS type A sorting domain-containing protein [Ignavibacteria bacterium]